MTVYYRFIIGLLTVLELTCFIGALPAFAENDMAAPSDGYDFLNLAQPPSIVEQLQTIHRLSQNNNPDAVMQLISALKSPYPLAQRKACKSIVEKVKTMPLDKKKSVVPQLQGALHSPDAMVQKDIVCLMADLHLPEAQKMLQSLFQGADKQTQLSAVDALSQQNGFHPDILKMAQHLSPFSEVREAANESLR